MTPTPTVEAALSRAKSVKENEADYPLPTIMDLALHRDDLIFLMWPPLDTPSSWPDAYPYHPKEMLLHAAKVGITSLGAQHAVFMSDSYYRRQQAPADAGITTANEAAKNLRDDELDRRFGGSMMKAWEAGCADEFGIFETMLVSVLSRTAEGCKASSGLVPYIDHGRDGIEWLESSIVDDDGSGGYVLDKLRDAFSQVDFLEYAMTGDHPMQPLGAEIMKGLTWDRIRFHCDIAALRLIAEQEVMIGIGADSKTGHEYERAINKYGWGPTAMRVKGPNRAQRRETQRRSHKNK